MHAGSCAVMIVHLFGWPNKNHQPATFLETVCSCIYPSGIISGPTAHAAFDAKTALKFLVPRPGHDAALSSDCTRL